MLEGILKPNRHGDEYINRKGKPTLNVQATCDAREMFTSVDVSWPGSVHDSRIWRNSQTRSQLINKANVVLLGDGVYGIEPSLMTPFINPTPGAEINYNKLLKQERVISERCFGQLKRRFPILHLSWSSMSEKIPISKMVGLTTDGAPAMLQGRCKELTEMISDIKAFIKKLEFWEQNLIDGDTRHFPILLENISQSPLETHDSKYHVEIVSTLKDNFKNRFKDFTKIAIVVQFVVSPFMEIDIQQFATSVTQNFSEGIAATEM
ncbi:unnamed protein product [Acanthoscelides obtectus]|uniref:DDE Tnp4 domain-containing protein n=1 Tax=Acanthoscelides obtectus TaxID=200917 RepID=A0A9P0LEB1_ACAOB|nr:unnamed protein product [Acanthoscelides obtectus]CAK1682019.1 Putative nuclease HARBI1 [Acanthoscelides obtectus]